MSIKTLTETLRRMWRARRPIFMHPFPAPQRIIRLEDRGPFLAKFVAGCIVTTLERDRALCFYDIKRAEFLLEVIRNCGYPEAKLVATVR